MSDIGDAVRAAVGGDNRVAWISPLGQVVSGSGSDGFPPAEDEALAFEADFSEVANELVVAERVREECQARCDEGDHGEWHHYEMSLDDHDSGVRRVLSAMHASGWRRVELVTEGTGHFRLTVSGAPDILSGCREELEETCKAAGWTLRENPADAREMSRLRRLANPPEPLCPPGANGGFPDGAAQTRWEMATEDFKRRGFGWLTPQREILTCGLHDHLDVASETGTRQSEFSLLDVARTNLERTRTSVDHLVRQGADGRRRMTANEAARKADANVASIKSRLVAGLYADGWIRLGIHGTGEDRVLDAEGGPATLRKQRNLLQALADWSEARMEPRRSGADTESPGRTGAFQVGRSPFTRR